MVSINKKDKWFERGKSFLAKGKCDESIEAFMRDIKFNPNRIQSYLFIAKGNTNKNVISKAKEYLRKAINIGLKSKNINLSNGTRPHEQ